MPGSESDFHAELESLLQRADQNGIDVEGGWDCRNGPEHPDWDIIITEVKKTTNAE
ncbi:hypothetical protein ACFQH2_06970 [Natronoarchaeum sp. GCM10025703]|uniref:hypothetical protein n=1 Tax=Natronoarchaeum sp. GCM10025321 TaxID=3252684 RepID=UPI0036076080